MRELFGLIKMTSLLAATSGRQEIAIGLIDGPVEASHPDLLEARLQTLPSVPQAMCRSINSPACLHGTFLAGVLCARRGRQAPAICPGCTLLVKPIFCEAARLDQCPTVTPQHLASAVM